MTATAADVEHVYSPRNSCRTLFETRDPEVLIHGPAGTGKTRACLEKLHAMALANPGMRALMVRKTQKSLSSTAVVTWKRDVAVETIEGGLVTYYGGSAAEPAQYRFANGSAVVLGGMDNPEKVMSSEWDLIYVNEATELTEDDWEKLTTRLRSNVVSFQQIMGDCNPSTPTHWLKRRGERGITTVLESRHEDNPTLYDEDGNLTDQGRDYMDRLDRLTGVRHARLRKGQWVAVEGGIYPEFDPAVHVIDPFPIPEDWMRWWAIDFGFVNPFVCQHWAESPDGDLHLYREFYGTRRIVAAWAQTILGEVTSVGYQDGEPVVEWTEPRPVAIICDHDAEGREVFARAIGQGTTPAHKAVTEGIEAVQRRLTDRRIWFHRDALVTADEHLRTMSKPTCTIEELPAYVWANPRTTAATVRVKENPMKEDDHGADAMRYVVAQRDLGSRPGLRGFL